MPIQGHVVISEPTFRLSDLMPETLRPKIDSALPILYIGNVLLRIKITISIAISIYLLLLLLQLL